MKRLSHKSKNVNSKSAPLQLIHMDLFGPVNVLSISRNKYALVMVDDFLRYTWVEFMHSKDETPHIIIDHIKNLETQAEDQNCVKRLRSDNGTEFRNTTLSEFSQLTVLVTGYATYAAAYKRLEDEEDAIYGISLLDAAAEQMERTAFDKTDEPEKGENCVDPTRNVVPSSETSLQTLCVDKSAQVSSKLKLQLFPVDETTRRALEKGISCISEEESSRISLGMCSPLREEKNGQITAKKRSKPGIFPVGSCAPAQQC
ncbi:hypothetical protein AgCh_035995 [Apium graveolens]